MRYLIRAFHVTALIALILAISTPPRASAAPDASPEVSVAVGTVAKLKPQAVALRDAVPRVLKEGSPLDAGDVVSTGPGARVEVTLTDGSKVTLGEKTIFVMSEVIAEGADASIALRLLEGAFKATTGAVAKEKPQAFKVETEFGAIGIRGTTFWGGVIDGAFGVLMLDGKGIDVTTPQGRVSLTKAGDGTAIPLSGGAPSAAQPWPDDKARRALATVQF